jgi:chromosome segregation ATPase
MATLDKYEKEKQSISGQVKSVNSKLANITQNVVSTKAEVEMVAERIESLSAELERLKLDSKAIERELKERPEMFEVTKQLEMQRQQRVRESSAPGKAVTSLSTNHANHMNRHLGNMGLELGSCGYIR